MKAVNLLPVVVALASWGADLQTLLHPMYFWTQNGGGTSAEGASI